MFLVLDKDSRRLKFIYIAAICICAGIATWKVSATTEASAEVPSLAVLGVIAVFASVIRELATEARTGEVVSSVVYLPVMCSLVILGPMWALALVVFTTLYGSLRSKKGSLKVTFNCAQMVIAVALAGGIYEVLGGTWVSRTSISSIILPYMGASLTYFAVNRTIVTGIVFLDNDNSVSFWETWRLLDDYALPVDVTLSLLALPAVHLYWHAGTGGLMAGLSPSLLLAGWSVSSMSAEHEGVPF